MLNIIKRFIRRLKASNTNALDISRFEDDVAEATEWVPLNTASANFNVYKLVSVTPNLLQYRATLGAKLFAGVFMTAGTAFLIALLVSRHKYSLEDIIPLLICIGFVVAGAWMLYSLSTPKLFDLRARHYLNGRNHNKSIVPFNDMHALQLIPNSVYGSDGSDFYNYQLNLVFSSGERINICYYNTLEIARNDMQKIASFIGKQCWDATVDLTNK